MLLQPIGCSTYSLLRLNAARGRRSAQQTTKYKEVPTPRDRRVRARMREWNEWNGQWK